MATDTQDIRAQWSGLLEVLMERWHHLTDADLRGLEDDIDRLVSRIQERTGETRQAIEARLADVAARAGATASRCAEEVEAQLRDGANRAEITIRRKPGKSLAAAFGCGLAAGLVLGLAVHRPRR